MDAASHETGLRLALAGGVADGRVVLRRAAALTPKLRADAGARMAAWRRSSHAPVLARRGRRVAPVLALRLSADPAMAAVRRAAAALPSIGRRLVRLVGPVAVISAIPLARTAASGSRMPVIRASSASARPVARVVKVAQQERRRSPIVRAAEGAVALRRGRTSPAAPALRPRFSPPGVSIIASAAFSPQHSPVAPGPAGSGPLATARAVGRAAPVASVPGTTPRRAPAIASPQRIAPVPRRPVATPLHAVSVAPVAAAVARAPLPPAPVQAPSRSAPGDDDFRLGHWLEVELTRAVVRPSAGLSAMDERLTPVFPGAPVG